MGGRLGGLVGWLLVMGRVGWLLVMGRVRGLVVDAVMLGRMRRLVADADGVRVAGGCWSREDGYGSQGSEAEGEESGDTHVVSWIAN